jgi:hypothetical protein
VHPSLAQKILCALGLAATALSVHAQAFPSKPITIIAPFATGGSADGIARVVAKELGQALGQPVVVDNKPGAGGATGLLLVAKAQPDGYTIGMGATGAIAIGPHLPDAPPLDPGKQLQPLAKLADIPLVLVAGAKSGYGSRSRSCPRPNPTKCPRATRASTPRTTCRPNSWPARRRPGCPRCPIAAARPRSPTSSAGRFPSPSST